MNVTLVEPNIGYSPLLNLGLAYLISAVEKKHDFSLIDLTFQWKNYLDYFKHYILIQKPDIIGFSVNSYNYYTGLKLANFTKKIYPHAHIVFGGVHPTIAPEEVIQEAAIDSICIGEGETSFPQFLDKLEKGEDPEVDGFWFKGRSGEIIRNRLKPFEIDLNTLPFVNWDHWDIKRYLATNFVHTGTGGLLHLASRGCPNNCNFCSVHVIRKAVPGNYYRTRKAENIIEEIKSNLIKYWDIGFRGVNMHDGLFGADWGQFEQFCSLYRKERLNEILPWSCMTRPEIVTERWCQLAANAGCAKVSIGIETANQYLRNKVYRKPTTDKQIEEAIANLEKYDIHYLFLMMIGCPEESKETIRQNMRFIKRHKPIEVRMPFCQPHPKTDYSKLVGKVLDDTDKELVFLKGDDICRAGTQYLTKGQLNAAIFHFRIWWVCKWIKEDFLRFGFRFLADLMTYLLNGKVRPLPFMHPYTYKVIRTRAHLDYYLGTWKKKHGIAVDSLNLDMLIRKYPNIK